MKLHPTTVLGLAPTEELGREIMSLRYDLLVNVLEGMLEEACRQQTSNRQDGRSKLAYRLLELGAGLAKATDAAYEVVKVCAPYIAKEEDYMTAVFKEPLEVSQVGEKIGFTLNGVDYVVAAPRLGTVLGGYVDENWKTSLVYL